MKTCDNDSLVRLSSIPGPRGPKGDPGAGGGTPPPGRNAFTTTTSPFVMPAAGAQVTITVQDTAWVAVGQAVFVEGAGSFGVITVLSATSLRLQALANSTNTASGTTITTGKKVTPGGVTTIDTTALTDLTNRVVVLENAPGGTHTYRQSTPPTGAGLRIGDLWYDTTVDPATGNPKNTPHRWDGTGWVDLSDAGVGGLVADLNALSTGVNTISTSVDSLKQEYVLAVVGTGPNRKVAGFRVTAPGGGSGLSEFVVQADKFVIVGPDGTGRDSPFYVSGGQTYIKDAVIPDLNADRITAGDLSAVNFGHTGMLFDPTVSSVPRRYFRPVDFDTRWADGKIFSAGNCLSTGYGHIVPVVAYGPGNFGWTPGGITAARDASGRVRVQLEGRLLGHTGNILLYYQKNSETPQALAAISSADSGNAVHSCSRIIYGVANTDALSFYVAPADGNGVITPRTCRYELDVMIFNW